MLDTSVSFRCAWCNTIENDPADCAGQVLNMKRQRWEAICAGCNEREEIFFPLSARDGIAADPRGTEYATLGCDDVVHLYDKEDPGPYHYPSTLCSSATIPATATRVDEAEDTVSNCVNCIGIVS